MKYLLIIIFPFICSISNYNISTKGLDEIAKSAFDRSIPIIESDNLISFEEVESRYDTLIPLFEGLFITYDKMDSLHFRKIKSEVNEGAIIFGPFSEARFTKDTKKWGVIDSTGNIIVPFICDGIKAISETEGVASVFSNFYALPTGLPRYKYIGSCYSFKKNGLIYETKKEFGFTIEYIYDWHTPEFVTLAGTEFYLPNEYAGRVNFSTLRLE